MPEQFTPLYFDVERLAPSKKRRPCQAEGCDEQAKFELGIGPNNEEVDTEELCRAHLLQSIGALGI